ncbi:predicted protein [Nematostella vectensis]|uniref:Mitochondrial inner membrane protein Mpv17 n=1 Tax=Nematostella vectensis TaxID=45351 RepID=A7RSR7_NEMVE|nr:protein Mpv17-like [Nematostella vectensis]EDO45507.1 predicted protein [Nematostella vectensis]|eukprot:XP_001637570.1 predicted protein [Nematostella vectensis]
MAGIWRTYQRLMVSHPWTTQTVSVGVVVAFGDVITQQAIERKGINHDVKRTLKMGAVGLFVGPIIRTWYLTLDKLVVASRRPKLDALKKVFLDQSLFAPCFIAVFFGIKCTVSGQTLDEYKQVLREHYLNTLIANYKLWPAVQIVTFSIIPFSYRVLFVQCFAVFWNTYLCWMANRPSETNTELVKQ